MNQRPLEPARAAGIVLAGGGSRRMGVPKPWLSFGPERMLQRVVRLLGDAVRPVVVAARGGQELPELPPWSHVVYDRVEGRGPMEGLAAALEDLQGRTELAFVAGCDAPLLAPRLVHRMIALADGFDIAVPHVDGLDHPLAAVYRTQLLAMVNKALARGSRRLTAIADDVRTRRVTADELTDVDPCLLSLMNINTPDEYRAALKQAGLAEPADEQRGGGTTATPS